ncbi:hypothetical protein [Aeromonas caviae]|uniref:hypothetical protein n=1 Tax=Aeromonas caviae TaxID=648 RepID=UPI0029DE63C8|nr:hypothetical protein [Aeromonas caviae]MDX7645481.1 hypothetical protein [Aeromonas caviae]
MKKPNLSQAAFLVALVLSGCATQKKADSLIEQARKELAQKSVYDPVNSTKAKYVSTAPVFTQARKQSDIPTWANRRVLAINANGIPFGLLADQLARMGGANVNMLDVEPNRSVRASIPAGVPLWQALDIVAASTGYSYEYTPTGVEWRKMVVRVYTLPTPVGERDFKLGTDDTKAGSAINFNAGGGSSSTNVTSTTASGGEQYSRLTGTPDRFKEGLDALQALVGKAGVVTGVKSSGQLVVKAEREIIAQTDTFMREFMRDMGRQARIEAKLLMFSSNESENHGADWNLVYKATDGLLSFDTMQAAPAGTGASPSKVSLKATGGRWSGSELLINALQEQGTVSVVTEPTDVLKNNVVTQLGTIDSKAFTAGTKVTPNPDGAASTEVTAGVVDQGLKLFILPKFLSNDKISLYLSSNISTLNGIVPRQINEVYQEQPEVSQNIINKEFDIQTGETWIISGIKQTISRRGERSTLGTVWLGGNKSADVEVVEMILLITVTDI